MGGLATKIKYGNVMELRAKYVSVTDYKVFQTCSIDDNLITHLVHLFATMDQRKTGRLDLAEFHFAFDINVKYISPAAKRQFICFDIEQKGKLSFVQFAAVVYNIALADNRSLLNFVFDSYFVSMFEQNDEMAQRVREMFQLPQST